MIGYSDTLCKWPNHPSDGNDDHDYKMELRCHVITLALAFSTATCATYPLGSKNTTVRETGEMVTFEWYQEDVDGRLGAVQFCEDRGSTVPRMDELRYFYKSLTLAEDSQFYLSDVMETTVDSPNEAIGERLCVITMSSPGKPLRMVESSAAISCVKTVNAVVCRRTTSPIDPLLYTKCLKFHLENDDRLLKLDPTSFYSALGAISLILLMTVCLLVIYCYKYYEGYTHTGPKSSALFAGPGMLRPLGLGTTGSNLGRYDLLPDVPLHRGSYRRSQRSPQPRKQLEQPKTQAEAEPETTLQETETDATGYL